ncbi:MAG: acyl-ACP--UDP-N-acetylglucosamine O-acyltransferase [Bacteroidota bacterium]|nr:acyl-ACP--UDP-N-acetylglucosamine O-acyltransferase [Candidatus Kapabacteria bacterium]MCS7302430.1 acyl-ACP--UDP-N-acetylglucosamine O-acyltransferase [Candidatus Kapabacteria bacterium]MCX7937096.1 acyl-ACP--UDP-N-acetylglucosamine O-acyltransferase [Chlorobiota bacterium]MDW8074589.1 acyl-ACP--UDP-N-acetylglucosamine O-acyltransferase [Bacteroidota bacterium]MDW8270935.1 acyl-ACP--UDP-N-acetylglucosamine O-acyltransferase [Bacteroidota bacterium]
MSTSIHPTAIVSPSAHIGENVSVGAYAIVEEDVEIGDGTTIYPHACILSGSRIGKQCTIFPCAIIGAQPQDLKYSGAPTLVVVGDRTTIREFVTLNRASHTDATRIGSDCLIMAYVHVAHDCMIGDHVVIANAVQLGGHVEIGEWAVLGGMAKVHQFCRIGKHAMVAADAMITKDVPPYALIGRDPVKVEGINRIGLQRRGFSPADIATLETFYSIAFFSGLNMSDGIAEYRRRYPSPNGIVVDIIEFVERSERGVYR